MPTKIQKSINLLLEEYLDGLSRQIGPLSRENISEILRIKSALDGDRPTADLIQHTILNAIEFLHKDYNLSSDDQFQTILDFLKCYHATVQQELLSKSSTYKEGMTLNIIDTI
jgi:hypothetical protein